MEHILVPTSSLNGLHIIKCLRIPELRMFTFLKDKTRNMKLPWAFLVQQTIIFQENKGKSGVLIENTVKKSKWKTNRLN